MLVREVPRRERALMATRNTSSSSRKRNTRPKASAQLQAFPRSENERLRQSNTHQAVVSVRLAGSTIAELDRIAANTKGERSWYRVSRGEIIKRAIASYLAARKM